MSKYYDRLFRFARANTGLLVALSALYVGSAAVLVLSEAQLETMRETISRNNVRLVVLGTFVALATLALYRFFQFYLNPSDEYQSKPSEAATLESSGFSIAELNERITRALSRIERRVAASSTGERPPPDIFRDETERQAFKEKIAEDIVREAIANLSDGIVTKLSTQSKFTDADRLQNDVRKRLYDVVLRLERRANLNLSVGATIGAAGVGLLIYLLYIAPPAIPTSVDHVILVAQYFSRVSIVLLVEIFAFFFLKLYSQTLGELRHTHNEITNIEMRAAGLQVAIASADKKSIAHAAQRAIDTERNFVLDKGKTTVDLERYKNDSEHAVLTLGILREIIAPTSKIVSSNKAKAS